MVFTLKLALLILVLSLSAVLYTIAFAVVVLILTGAKATGLPALLREPLYWVLMVAILGGEVWIAIHKVRW